MKRLFLVLTSLLLGVGLSLVAAPPSHAGWTGNPNHNAGGWATISLNFNTTKINAGTYRLHYAQVCMWPGNGNVTELKAGGNIQIRGSGGGFITNMYVPRVGRNACVNVVPNPSNLTVGSGACGTYSGVVNVNGWVPYPDVSFSFGRGVVNSGVC